jgi:hypothetical protein
MKTTEPRIWPYVVLILAVVFAFTVWLSIGLADYLFDGGLARDLGRNVQEYEKAKGEK